MKCMPLVPPPSLCSFLLPTAAMGPGSVCFPRWRCGSYLRGDRDREKVNKALCHTIIRSVIVPPQDEPNSAPRVQEHSYIQKKDWWYIFHHTFLCCATLPVSCMTHPDTVLSGCVCECECRCLGNVALSLSLLPLLSCSPPVVAASRRWNLSLVRPFIESGLWKHRCSASRTDNTGL